MSDTLAHRVVIRRHGAPDVLHHETWSIPDPDVDDVQVAVEYAGVNFADIMMRMGLYPEAPDPPFVPGYEVAGTIVAKGEGVRGLKIGDRVVAATRFGGYTSRINLADEDVVVLPKSLETRHAAAMPVQYLTAYLALHEFGRVRKGDRVLIHQAAGGVGLAAITMAKHAGCEVVGCVGSRQKAGFLHDEYDIHAVVRGDEQDLGGLDVILDPIGGTNLKQSLRELRPGGRVIAYGASGIVAGTRRNPLKALKEVAAMRTRVIPLMEHNTGIMGLNLLTLWRDRPEMVRNAMKEVLSMVAKQKIPVPRIDSEFPLADAADAHQRIHDHANMGKILLDARHTGDS